MKHVGLLSKAPARAATSVTPAQKVAFIVAILQAFAPLLNALDPNAVT